MDEAGEANHRERLLHGRSISAAVFLTILMGAGLIRHGMARAPTQPLPAIQSTLNPNTATWAELSTLPRLGETTARKIVRFRQDASKHHEATDIFDTADSLARVRGIGPKTVERLAPSLHFDAP